MINLELRQGLLASLADLEAGDTVLVGLSGGADSLSLLKCAVVVGKAQSINVGAVIIDHQIQAESAKTSQVAAQAATDLGADPVLIFNVDVATGPGIGGMEAAARDARRQAFARVAVEHNAKAILLGHTLEDQAETVLLGLARGSGARSLSGMRAAEGIYRRPFLNVDRETVRSEVKDLVAFEDPHNSDTKFSRVRVRNTILPILESELGPGVTQALVRSADLLRDDADALDAIASAEISRHNLTDLECSELELLPRAIRTRILRSAIYAAGAPSGSISADHIGAVEALITSWHGQGLVSLPGGVKVERISGRLSLSNQ